ncbi:hypothetical protein LAV84_25680 [Rhizobium sp. VS19-DR104.2]|uniref:hypothetical protein n=1 Tax=unclassified Rhizobium TaxID=2613769 RepID=UPI001CC54EA4|nr:MULTISPECIES: hypothetical protein [unclassified Rhizobium]MBZ5762937.1 hypothetical protein [Rhizobium sp. VS19-DR96]MBZ5768770.1 hypothetical protein [Rhizobium sp. VS19-DR129.2]MBZ5776386.1 hypothetical protein [Rhizobium sp. VS19-DRK62.2]MBZ5787593.1 hypothetical protein [Rhizobium sp. VS19-DR121]MBZ5804948.1 hypothetical protein [Rhizobium sp. VS19-DR181]
MASKHEIRAALNVWRMSFQRRVIRTLRQLGYVDVCGCDIDGGFRILRVCASSDLAPVEFPLTGKPVLGLFQLILARFCQRRLCLPQLVLLL